LSFSFFSLTFYLYQLFNSLLPISFGSIFTIGFDFCLKLTRLNISVKILINLCETM
ncbi:hypothetical protein Leryth_025019, partial [Lithospermum erythrorhizon]